ncbi:ATP-dependent RNA helicase DRS1 [Scheffersomyces coipomensis]|uniref:ATP-dependent RNA helicase DRS1 n=1 Tax=Scheffersomyces coipomensis TaxID=1788519 RepID=UPI00315DDAB4
MTTMDDLIGTIDSDSETEGQIIYESESEYESETQEVKKAPKKSKKKSKGKGKSTQDQDKKDEEEDKEKENDDINPNFQFSVDGFSNVESFDGWDFDLKKPDSQRIQMKDVDLDGILRRKGGLVNIADVDNDTKVVEEEDDDEEEEDNEEVENGDDEELAMDGFGMGAEEEDDEEEEEEEQEEAPEEEFKMGGGAVEEIVENEDTKEDMDKFYSTQEESDVTKKQAHNSFQTLQLSRPVLKGLAQLGYVKPSPIQSASIPIALLGKDIVAGAVTGSGKTAAYMIPIIERLLYKPAKIATTRVIVLTPTRELAIQVCDVGKNLGRFVNNLNFGLAVGGLNLRQQEQQLKTRPDIVIATPGRLIDHIRNSPSFTIDALEVLVIDEADRMLDEGFQAELTEILALIPKNKRQTLLFSATMNTKIQDLIQLSLDKPVRIMIDPPKATATKLVQQFVRIRKRDALKPALLFNLLRELPQQERVVVFVARKESAHKLRIVLGLLGLKVSELHGSLTQEQRLRSVTEFKNLTVPVLICTDLAARGLDIPKIAVVINYDMPKTHEIYLHRIGRTARAGRDGISISFIGESSQERGIVKEALKSLTGESKAVSRNINWIEVEKLNKILESKATVIEEVLEEEQQEKEILHAEMELKKASNMMKHEKEIQSRPRRTWFEAKRENQTEVMGQLTKQGKKVNSRKRKANEEKKETKGARSYKKTKVDRMTDQKRNPKAKIGKGKKR